MPLPTRLNELIELFEGLPEAEKRENLISLAATVPSFRPQDGANYAVADVRKDEECTDTVGIFLRVDVDGTAQFAAELGPKVQTLTRALTAILCQGFNGADLPAILATPESVVQRIIGADLVRLRSRTVYYVLNRMKAAIRQYQEEQGNLAS